MITCLSIKVPSLWPVAVRSTDPFPQLPVTLLNCKISKENKTPASRGIKADVLACGGCVHVKALFAVNFFFFFSLWQIYLIHMKQILYTFHLHIYIHFKDIHVTIYLVYNNYKYSISASMFAISFTLNLVHFSNILKRVINSFLNHRNIILLFLDLSSKDSISHSL